MIENWNREDRKIFELKDQIKKLIEKDPEVEIFFNGIKLKGVDDVDMDAKQEEISKKFDELVDKYPEFGTILADLSATKISNLSILSYDPPPIKIKFNSPGGWMVAYHTLADVIALSKTKVIGINMGMAYSAAAFLLIACHERLALPKSRMLIHRGSGGNFGSYEQTESAQQNYKEEVDEIIASFKKRTNVPENVLREKMAPDWYLSANMALKYGIIDRIITDITEIL
jgi:ATP-dependent Clp protease protease subunit